MDDIVDIEYSTDSIVDTYIVNNVGNESVAESFVGIIVLLLVLCGTCFCPEGRIRRKGGVRYGEGRKKPKKALNRSCQQITSFMARGLL